MKREKDGNIQATFCLKDKDDINDKDDKFEISQVPSDYKNLKETIKKLFKLNDQQLNNCTITYKDKYDKEFYIIDEETYKIPKLVSEDIVFNIKLQDNNYQADDDDEDEHFIGEENDFNSQEKKKRY